jgi:pyrimidine-nucleoside phosphorylase
LHGGGPADFRNHCLVVAGYMLFLGGKVSDAETGRQMAEQAISDGKAWEKFRLLVQAQGGDVDYIDHPERFPSAKLVRPILATRSGFLAGINAQKIGELTILLGAGRTKKGDPVDHAVGIEVLHKVGDQLKEGDPLFTIHANDQAVMDEAIQQALSAHTWSDELVEPLPLFYGVIE